jgi:hypothetical protein
MNRIFRRHGESLANFFFIRVIITKEKNEKKEHPQDVNLVLFIFVGFFTGEMQMVQKNKERTTFRDKKS